MIRIYSTSRGHSFKCSNLPRISIVTSSYNQAQYLQQTISSIRRQNYPNLEYIIIDGGSKDSSVDIIVENLDIISYWHSKVDRGCADALNQGLEIATGDYFCYINSDDFLTNNALLRFAQYVSRNPNCDVYCGHGIERSEFAGVSERMAFSANFTLSAYMQGRASIFQPSTFFRLSTLRSKAKFNINNRTCWDGELLVDLALNGAVFNRMPFNYILSIFRLHGESISGTGRLHNQHRNDVERIRRKIMELRPELQSQIKIPGIVLDLYRDPKLLAVRTLSRLI